MSKNQTSIASFIAVMNLTSAIGIFLHKGNITFAWINIAVAVTLALWVGLKGQ